MTGITTHSLHNEEAAEISEIPTGVWTSQVHVLSAFHTTVWVHLILAA